MAVNKSIHKTHIHLIILQHYELFPRMTLGLGEKNGEWTSEPGPVVLVFKKHTGGFEDEILSTISKVKHQTLTCRNSSPIN